MGTWEGHERATALCRPGMAQGARAAITMSRAELHLSGGLATEETGEATNLSPATVERDWPNRKLNTGGDS